MSANDPKRTSAVGILRCKLTPEPPFRGWQILAVISRLKIGVVLPWDDKPQSGYSAKPQGEDPKGCAP
jgi:hypothetical protein